MYICQTTYCYMFTKQILLSFIVCSPFIANCADGLDPIPTANMYQNSGTVSVWSSFGTIAIALVAIGFAIRAVVLVKLAMTGERNPIQIVWTLLVAVIGFGVVKALL